MGWENAGVFKMGRVEPQKLEIWWATWRWSGWVRTQYTREEWQAWEAERHAEAETEVAAGSDPLQ